MKHIKIKDIIEWAEDKSLPFEFFGNMETEVNSFSSLRNYKDKSITWINLKNPVDEGTLSRIHCAIVQKGVTKLPDNYFLTSESKKFFFSVLEHFFSDDEEGIAQRHNTFIGEKVLLGDNVRVGCNCVLDGDIQVGANTCIEHNVTILNRVAIGSDCIIHSGTVIGKDGYGYSFDSDNTPKKVPHYGGVKIGDRVEIGCNCVIDRGTIDDTSIGDDTKIDSLVLIAHNDIIGDGALIVGGTTIGGSCEIGDNTYVAPHATIKNKTTIGNSSFIGMGVITAQNVDANSFIGRSGDKPRIIKDYRRFL